MTVQSLVWLRRDLRLHDHAALANALAPEGNIQPVFVFDSEILARFPNKEDRRLTFIAETLCQMHEELQKRGGGLLVFHGNPEAVIPHLASALGVKRVVAAADFEPSTLARDRTVADALGPEITFTWVKDHLIRAPKDVLKSDGTAYKVFTPYSKAWRASLSEDDLAERVVKDKGRYADLTAMRKAATKAGFEVLKPEEGPAKLLERIGYTQVEIPLWRPEDAKPRLERFLKKHLSHYADMRDFMGDEDSTSKISPYLRFGLVSIREAAKPALAHPKGTVWSNELIWREFYAMILYHYPETVEWEFQPHYRARLSWNSNKNDMKAWMAGRTGYPVVDAAMRQLVQDGWMHNRARMIVASFLTKHLQVDWRVGEEFFAQYLMDYEQASNVGGWQWASSTGTDAQPYFRVFNPTTQSERFDSKGDYIRKYVPELAALDAKSIHEPHKMKHGVDYAKPIVEHAKAREAAIAMFKELK